MRILRLTLAGTLTLSPDHGARWSGWIVNGAIGCGSAAPFCAPVGWQWFRRRSAPGGWGGDRNRNLRRSGEWEAPGIAHIGCRTTFMAFEVRQRHGA